jgi:energy-coupling factor transporter ATP-binding protein EcfA2
MKFLGKNFQPWAEFNLNLEGLTVLVGPSDKGKSSIFRALKGLLRNELPATFVRNGQPNPLDLTLEVPDHTIQAIRKANGSTEYIVDGGKKFTSLGGKLPQQVIDLNMGEIQIGEYHIDPIFASQFGRQFMLETSGPTELNTILGAFASTENLEFGKKQANLFITQKNNEARTLAREISEAEERKSRLSSLLSEATVVKDEIARIEPFVRSLEAGQFWLGKVAISRARIFPLQQIVASLTIPDTSQAQLLKQQKDYLLQAAESLKWASFLRQVETAITPLTILWSEIVTQNRRVRALNEVLVQVQRKEQLSNLDVIHKLNVLIKRTTNELETTIHQQDSIKYAEQAAFLKKRVVAKQSELASLEKQISSLQKTSGLCPKCGKPLEHVCGS